MTWVSFLSALDFASMTTALIVTRLLTLRAPTWCESASWIPCERRGQALREELTRGGSRNGGGFWKVGGLDGFKVAGDGSK